MANDTIRSQRSGCFIISTLDCRSSAALLPVAEDDDSELTDSNCCCVGDSVDDRSDPIGEVTGESTWM